MLANAGMPAKTRYNNFMEKVGKIILSLPRPAVAIIAGALLMLMGVVSYVSTPTALIPAFIGGPLVGFGLVAAFSTDLRARMLIFALAAAALGGSATLISLFTRGGAASFGSVASKLVTILLCAGVVALDVRVRLQPKGKNREQTA